MEQFRSIYSFCAPLSDGSDYPLEELRGRVLLPVNTASRCGFTPQYAELEELFVRYGERGLTPLAFPCDQFLHQEPGSNAEIGQFCQRNYGVTFPVFAKIKVNGPETHPLFIYLKQSCPGIFGRQRIGWNFTKFLVNRQGQPVARFAPTTSPLKLIPRIEELLAQS